MECFDDNNNNSKIDVLNKTSEFNISMLEYIWFRDKVIGAVTWLRINIYVLILLGQVVWEKGMCY